MNDVAPETWKPEAIVIGASAGAVEALFSVLSGLPQNYSIPIMVVVHLPPDKKSVIAELLQAKCEMDVHEAMDKEPIKPGTIYFAPPDYHMLVESGKFLSLSTEEPVLFSRPAIDVLFETAADVYGKNLLGIILSGASSDGANGLKMIMEEGGRVIVQNPKGAYATPMPEAAIAACPDAEIMSLKEIANYIYMMGTP
jgi:two-component system chemotaxis response regulator CheB